MVYKCFCQKPDVANWSVIRISGRDRIVRCAKCRQVWHTQAAYALDLPEDPIPTFLWRKLIHSADYHKGELPLPDEPAAGYCQGDHCQRDGSLDNSCW